MPTLEPFANNLVLSEFQLGEVSKGGLLIPQVAKASTPYRFARVIAVGPGRYAADGTLVPCSAKPGDTVAFAKNQGYEFPLDDENGDEQVYRMVNESFVMGRMHGLPEQSLLTGLDGKLLQMRPGSRAPSDGADQQQDMVERAHKQGIIDTQGNTLEMMDHMDAAESDS
jgi:chaperonin GroES